VRNMAAPLGRLGQGVKMEDSRFLNPDFADEDEMASHDSPGYPQSQPPEDRSIRPLPGLDFRALNARTADPNQADADTWDLRRPGLTDEIRWTLAALKRELAIEAYRWGGSPTAFLPISWARWKEMLAVNSTNAAKTRLARLEKLGLIEVLPSERGSWGSSLNGYRLGRGEGTQVFQGVMEARERSITRLKKAKEAQPEAADTTLNPGHANPGAAPGNRAGGGQGRLDEGMAKHSPSVPHIQPWSLAWPPTLLPGNHDIQINQTNLT